eukprot:1813154-Rhodomonas_salina.1
MVELWFGEYGIAGAHCISAIRSSTWSDVIDRLNRSINSQGNPGTPSENLTQCLRDCGVVPRRVEGKTKKNWRKPVDGVWEFSVQAWEERQARLVKQYTGLKRKCPEEEEECEEASRSSRPAASKRTSRCAPSTSSATALPAPSSLDAIPLQAALPQAPPSERAREEEEEEEGADACALLFARDAVSDTASGEVDLVWDMSAHSSFPEQDWGFGAEVEWPSFPLSP